MEFGDLNKLTSAELRKLLTLVSRETTLKRYKHECSDQRLCMTCNKWFCYACYNAHLNDVHGPAIAQFNGRLDEQTNIIQPERKEKEVKIKIKTTVKTTIRLTPPRAPKTKSLNLAEISQRASAGEYSKSELEQLIAQLKEI